MVRRIRGFLIILLTFLMIFAIPLSVNAALPTDSYTYWEDVGTARKSVYNKPMYNADFALSASQLGIKEFAQLKYVCTDNANNVYLLDSDSRIVVLDSNFKLLREIGKVGGTESYDKSNSIYVHTDGTIYICDTKGGRIIHSNGVGELIEIISLRTN